MSGYFGEDSPNHASMKMKVLVFSGIKGEMNFNLVCLFQKIKSHKVNGETSKTLPDPYEGK